MQALAVQHPLWQSGAWWIDSAPELAALRDSGAIAEAIPMRPIVDTAGDTEMPYVIDKKSVREKKTKPKKQHKEKKQDSDGEVVDADLDPELAALRQRLVSSKMLKPSKPLVHACHASPNSFKKSVENAFAKVQKHGPSIFVKKNPIRLDDRYDLFKACVGLAGRDAPKLTDWREAISSDGQSALCYKFFSTYIVQTLALMAALPLARDRGVIPPLESDWNLMRQRLSGIMNPSETKKFGGTLDYTAVVAACGQSTVQSEADEEMGKVCRWYRLYRLPGALQALTDYAAVLDTSGRPMKRAQWLSVCDRLVEAYEEATRTWLATLRDADASQLAPQISVLTAILN